MASLDPRIEAVRAKYDLDANDFWQIKQNKQWVCKHAALEIVAVKAGIEWLPPQILEADAPNLITSMIVTGKMGDRVEWSTGETNKTNYSIVGKQPAYPWAMSEKRAKDRVVLKLVGIHGLVYSEDEMPTGEAGTAQQPAHEESPTPKPISAAEQKRQCEEIDRDLLDCHTIPDVNKCAKVWASIMDRDGWSKTYRDFAIPKFKARREKIAEDEPFPGGTDITDQSGRKLNTMEAA
jgi:hypothetical protein